MDVWKTNCNDNFHSSTVHLDTIKVLVPTDAKIIALKGYQNLN